MATGELSAKSDMSELDCSICLSHFRDPKLLTCFHTFCMQCLEEYVIRTGKDGTFECPLCRSSMEIPVGGVKSFQSNFYIKVEGISEADVDCDACENGQKSSHYCIECEEHFCERCAVSHSNMKITRQHKTIALGSSADAEICTRKVQKKTYCPHHSGEEIKMICKDCNILLCVVCKLTEHEHHCTSGIAKEAVERRATLSEKVVEVKSTVESLKSTVDKVETRSDEIQKKLEMSVAEIDKCLEQLVKKIREDSDKMKQELLKSCTDVLHYYTNQKKQLLEKISEGEAVISHTQNVIDVGSDLHILDKNLQTKLQSLKSTTANLAVKDMTHLTFKASNPVHAPYQLGKNIRTKCKFSVVKENVINGVELIGNTWEAKVIAVSAGNVYAGFHDFSSLLKHNTETKLTEVERPLFDDIEEGSVSGLAVDEKGMCFFSHLHSRSLYKFPVDKPWEKLCGIKICKFDSFPHGICIIPSSKACLRDLLVCVLDTADSKTFESRSSTGCVMAVPVRLTRAGYSEEKMYRWREEETPGPTCVAVSFTIGLVCLGYPASRKVTLNSSDGDLLSEFTGVMDFGSPEKFCPTGVCFDNEQGLLIADPGNDAVIRIDENGMYIQCIIKDGRPLCMAFGKDGMLYVGFKSKDITCYRLTVQDRL